MLELLWFVELMMNGFFMGAVLGSWLETITFSKISGHAYVSWHQSMDGIFSKVAPVLSLTWLFSVLALLFSVPSQSTGYPFIFAIFLSWMSFFVVTVWIELPINREIQSWTLETIPAQWDQLRRRWSTFQGWRGFIVMTGFVFSLLALFSTFMS